MILCACLCFEFVGPTKRITGEPVVESVSLSAKSRSLLFSLRHTKQGIIGPRPTFETPGIFWHKPIE